MFEGKWQNEEIKDLFLEVEKAKENKKSLKEAFKNHAQKYDRRPNSVRNYYYHEVDLLLRNKSEAKFLNIDISKHKKQQVKFFSESEGEKIVDSIKELVKKGDSVRGACLKLSGGNISLMLRYQNKYRNSISKKEDQNNTVNIMEYRKKQVLLTDTDLNGLFLGLVKLVKRVAYSESEQKIKEEKIRLNNMLLSAKNQLEEQEKEIKTLREQLSLLKSKNSSLSQKLLSIKLQNAEVLTKQNFSF